MSKAPHELTFHKNQGDGPAWYCASCGNRVCYAYEGSRLHYVMDAQGEHECSIDAAKARLPKDLKRIKSLLEELGVTIQLHWSGYEDAELVLEDTKTRTKLHLGTEELG